MSQHYPTNAPVSVIQIALCDRLEAYRISRNLKHEDLAHEAGISRSTLSRMLSGEAGTLNTFIRIIHALGLTERFFDAIPDASVSPIAELNKASKSQSRTRVRAPAPSSAKPWRWDEDAGGGNHDGDDSQQRGDKN